MRFSYRLVLTAALSATCLRAAGIFWGDSSHGAELLIHELTMTPERQQRALDELAKYDDKDLVQLAPHLVDNRRLASTDVKFLNTGPKAFEKYYMTEASRVDEVLIRYICWSTSKCNPIFDASDLSKARRDAMQVLNELSKQQQWSQTGTHDRTHPERRLRKDNE